MDKKFWLSIDVRVLLSVSMLFCCTSVVYV